MKSLKRLLAILASVHARRTSDACSGSGRRLQVVCEPIHAQRLLSSDQSDSSGTAEAHGNLSALLLLRPTP